MWGRNMLRAVLLVIVGIAIDHILKKFFKEKARLVYYLQDISDHDVQLPIRTPSPTEPNPPTQTYRIYTHSIIIINNGDRAAHNVEVAHAFLPDHITINPPDVQFYNR
jgi:hypothetical protein